MAYYITYVFIVEGAAVFVCNAIVGICTFCAMRKRSAFLLIGAMLTMEAVYGLGFFLIGLDWIAIADRNVTVTQSTCILLPANLVHLFSYTSIATLPFLVAGDRMIAVFFPMKYLKLGFQFALKILILPVFFSLAIVIYFILQLLDSTVMVPINCSFVYLMSNTETRFLSLVRIIFTSTSISAYMPILLWLRKAHVGRSTDEAKFINHKQAQRRVTLSATFDAINTFALFNVPDISYFILPNHLLPTILLELMAILMITRSLLSPIIFLTINREVRYMFVGIYQGLGKTAPAAITVAPGKKPQFLSNPPITTSQRMNQSRR